MPLLPQEREAAPGDLRVRVLAGNDDAANAGLGDARRAGPVRPVWLQGSSVQYSVAPRARAPASSSA